MTAGSARAWQLMVSGRRLDLLNPSPEDITIEDIAHGLSRVARWNGQTKGIYAFSVAQHSLLVETLLSRSDPARSKADRLAALLHDAPEYVIGDMISPFKAVIGGDYKKVEHRLLHAIHQRFGIDLIITPALTAAIKDADGLAAFHEAVTLAGFETEDALAIFGLHAGDTAIDASWLDPMPAEKAKTAFLDRFSELFG